MGLIESKGKVGIVASGEFSSGGHIQVVAPEEQIPVGAVEGIFQFGVVLVADKLGGKGLHYRLHDLVLRLGSLHDICPLHCAGLGGISGPLRFCVDELKAEGVQILDPIATGYKIQRGAVNI